MAAPLAAVGPLAAAGAPAAGAAATGGGISGLGALFGGISALSSIFDFRAQQQQAVDQTAFFQAQQAAALSDLQAFDLQSQAAQQNILQETSFEDFTRQRQALRERGSLRAAIAETGVLGNTPIRQLNQAFFQEGLDVGNISGVGQQRVAQSQAQRQAEATRTAGRISVSQAQERSVRSPNPFLAGLSIASSGASGFLFGQSLSSKRKRFRG